MNDLWEMLFTRNFFCYIRQLFILCTSPGLLPVQFNYFINYRFFQPFYRETRFLHDHLPVLRPSISDTNAANYQIALTDNVHLKIAIDPLKPRSVPRLELVG